MSPGRWVLITTAVCFGLCALNFFGNYAERKKLPSLVCGCWAVVAMGLPLRELHWIPLFAADYLLAGACVTGLVSVLILSNWEMQQAVPFGWVRWWRERQRKRRRRKGAGS